MLRRAMHTWALQVIRALDETAPRLVLLASKPYSGSHLTRRIMEAASDQCTLSVYPEGVSLGPRQNVVAAARSLDRYQTTLSLSIDNERERKKAGFPPCEPPTGWYLVKTHNDQTTKPPGDLFGHAFRSVKVFRLARNPFDNVMREILGDARSREKLLAPAGEAAAVALVGAADGGCPTEIWTQCGGEGFKGDTCCPAGASCIVRSTKFSQCVPQ